MSDSIVSLDARVVNFARATRKKLWISLATPGLLASFLVLFCSTSVRLFMISRADVDQLIVQYSDAPTYLAPAESIIDRGAFLNNRGRSMISRTPGYPAFLAGLMLLVGHDLKRVLISQAIILSLGPLVLYWLARRLLAPVAALTAGLIAAFSPWGAVLAIAPMSDGLFLFMLIGIFLLVRVAQDQDQVRIKQVFFSIGIGVLTGIAVLVRPIWPLLFLLPGMFLFCYWPKHTRIWHLLLFVNLTCAVIPVALWKQRNQIEAHFNGISDIAGQTVWRYLAARVRAEATGESRFVLSTLAYEEEHRWGVPISSQEADDERWRQSKAVFREHPFLTVYSFGRSALEHTIHPSPDVLTPAKLNFPGDVAVLAVLWGTMLLGSAYEFWRHISEAASAAKYFEGRCIVGIGVVCIALTLTSGISFAAGSRLRAPLEAIVPLLVATSLVRVIRVLNSVR